MITLDCDLVYDKYAAYLKENSKEQLDAIASEIYRVYKEASSDTLRDLTTQIDENINFYRGKHYLSFDETSGRYRERERSVFNMHIPRSMTPYVTKEVDSVVSLLTRNRERFSVVENSTEAEDKNKARIAEAILEGNYYMNNELYNKVRLVKIATLCGTSYRKDFWDSSYTYVDSKGKLLTGETKTRILSPLDVIPDYNDGLLDINEGRYFIEFGFFPVSLVKKSYGIKEVGYTGYADKVEEDKSVNIQLDYLQKLKDPKDYGDGSVNKTCIILQTYMKPSMDFPEGLFIVSTNKEILYINNNKALTQFGGRFWLPYTELRYIYDPFSHYGIALPTLIIPLNKKINRIDNLVEINRATMVSPKILAPEGSLKPDQVISGRPAQIITYRQGLGDKPSFEYGRPLDQSVLLERENAVAEISKISGSNEVLQGNRPVGVGTTSGLSLLLEQSYSQFNIFNLGLEEALAKAYTKVLNLKRFNYTEKREDYFNRIKAMNSSLTKVAIQDFFTGNDIGNNIDVRIEQGSTKPNSSVVEKQLINEAAQLGTFGVLDPVQNPIGNKYYLHKIGLTDFSTPTNKDTTRAQWENDLIRNGRFDQVAVLPMDNNVIHYKVLNEEIKRPEFYDNNSEEVCDFYFKHLCEHFQEMTPNEYAMCEINEEQIAKFDTLSINYKIITQEEIMMKRNPPMQGPEQGEAMIGQDPNMQPPLMPEGQMPNDSTGNGEMQDINPSGMM